MGRHAFLIMAHNRFDFLRELLLSLDDERNDIYLHIDKKASDFDPDRFSNLLSQARLILTERLCVHWGGYSQIACELLLLKTALTEEHDYYHLLSGSDLPLKSPDELHAFFEAHKGTEFIAFDKTLSPQTKERVSLWHFFRESSFFLAEPADHAATLLQRLLRIDRLLGTGIMLRKGPNWFSITEDLARWITEREAFIEKHFRRSVCADELFLQTLAMASPFQKHIYDASGKTGSMANLRYVDWERGDGNSPYTFQEEDREFLLELPHLFARKFERNILKEQ